MAGNGYFDPALDTYFARSIEGWANYTSWDSFTSWDGTPASNLEFTTSVIDAGKIDFNAPIVRANTSTPMTIVMQHGDTMDSSGGEIDSPTSVTIAPNSSNITVPKARFYKFTLQQGVGDSAGNSDSAGSELLQISDLVINFRNTTSTLTQSDIDTSTLAGSTGQRQLSFNTDVGSVTNCLVQPHITGLDDSGGDPVRPIVYIDKSSSPIVLNIFDLDSYGKARRIDCTVDIQIQFLPQLSSDNFGQTEVKE